MKKDNTIKIVGLIALVGIGYMLMNQQPVKPPQVPPGYNPTTLPNGVTVWVNNLGQVVNSLGQAAGNIVDLINQIKQQQAVKGNYAAVAGIGNCGCNNGLRLRSNTLACL